MTKGKKPPLRPLGGGHPVELLQTGDGPQMMELIIIIISIAQHRPASARPIARSDDFARFKRAKWGISLKWK